MNREVSFNGTKCADDVEENMIKVIIITNGKEKRGKVREKLQKGKKGKKEKIVRIDKRDWRKPPKE